MEVIIILACVFWIVCLLCYRYERRDALLTLAIAYTCLMFLTIPQLFLQGFCTVVFAIFATKRSVPTWAFGLLSAASVFLIIWAGLSFTMKERAQILAWREQYPFESLKARLAYEELHQPVQELVLSEEVANRLADVEHYRTHSMRAWALERVHDESYYQFIKANGFGYVRMRRIHERDFELPAPESIRREELRNAFYNDSFNDLTGDLWVDTHRTSESDFLNINKLGYVKDIEHVAGFKAHHFSSSLPSQTEQKERENKTDRRNTPPQNAETTPFATEKWHINSIDLVGLLKYPMPMVYLTNKLPDMNELSRTTTRSLDEFETNALKRLRADEDLVIEEQADKIRMLGSLRANSDCLQCHQVSRGELLGAFSYRISRQVDGSVILDSE